MAAINAPLSFKLQKQESATHINLQSTIFPKTSTLVELLISKPFNWSVLANNGRQGS